MARCTSAAATAESTPPDRPQMARAPPTCLAILATCSSMMPRMVQSWRQPAATRNRRSISRPAGVCATSGWNCTPYSRRAGSCTAATGEAAVRAVTVNPGGACVQVSPWDIHTCCGSGSPANSPPSGPGGGRAAASGGGRAAAAPSPGAGEEEPSPGAGGEEPSPGAGDREGGGGGAPSGGGGGPAPGGGNREGGGRGAASGGGGAAAEPSPRAGEEEPSPGAGEEEPS